MNKNYYNLNSKGFFPAASFMSFQHVLFNFGSKPFKYPPTDFEFRNFNEFSKLPLNKKCVLQK